MLEQGRNLLTQSKGKWGIEICSGWEVGVGWEEVGQRRKAVENGHNEG